MLITLHMTINYATSLGEVLRICYQLEKGACVLQAKQNKGNNLIFNLTLYIMLNILVNYK